MPSGKRVQKRSYTAANSYKLSREQENCGCISSFIKQHILMQTKQEMQLPQTSHKASRLIRDFDKDLTDTG